MKNSNEQSLKEVLKEMVEVYRLKAKLNQTKIEKLWAKMMGATIAGYTTEIKMRRKKLFLTINSASLKQELAYGREKVRRMLNEELGEEVIEEVVIR